MPRVASRRLRLRQRRRHRLQALLATLVGAGLALAAWGIMGTDSSDEPRPGKLRTACVTTDMDGPVNFQYRSASTPGWIDAMVVRGQWQRIDLDAGSGIELPGDDPVEVLVRYDDDPGDGVRVVRQRIAAIHTPSSACPTDIAAYVFRERDDELFLDDADDEVDTAADRPPQANQPETANWI